jgi:DNA polymerase III delta subunit
VQIEPRAAAPEIAAALGIHPYVAQKSLALAKKIPLERLAYAHQLLTELDEAAKSGQGDHRHLLEIFLGKYLLLANKV